MTSKLTSGPLFAEVHNVPDDYEFTDAELDRIIAGDMFTPRQAAIMARELKRKRACLESEPAAVEFIPKNLDRALGVLGMALPESEEEFNLQTNRWIQRLIDRVIRYSDEFQEQPAPVVPDEIKHRIGGLDWGWEGEFNRGWNACRAAMLNDSTNTDSANPPEIPDGWVDCSERMPEVTSARVHPARDE